LLYLQESRRGQDRQKEQELLRKPEEVKYEKEKLAEVKHAVKTD